MGMIVEFWRRRVGMIVDFLEKETGDDSGFSGEGKWRRGQKVGEESTKIWG